jgi:hypothetical protein
VPAEGIAVAISSKTIRGLWEACRRRTVPAEGIAVAISSSYEIKSRVMGGMQEEDCASRRDRGSYSSSYEIKSRVMGGMQEEGCVRPGRCEVMLCPAILLIYIYMYTYIHIHVYI